MYGTNYLAPWNRVLPEKLTGPQRVTKFPEFYETEGLISRLEETATCLYLQPDRSSACSPPLPSHFSEINFNIILPSTPAFSSCFSSLPTKPCIHLSSLPYLLHALSISVFLSYVIVASTLYTTLTISLPDCRSPLCVFIPHLAE